LGPIFLATLFFLPLLFAGSGGPERIVVVDGTTTRFGERVADSLAASGTFKVAARVAPRVGLLDSLTRAVIARRLDGFLILTDQTLEAGIAEYGVNVMSSVLEEKTTRVVEVLVSSLRPFQLMLGKILGVGAVSIFQFVIWGVSGRLLLTQRAALGGGMASAESGAEAFELPQ